MGVNSKHQSKKEVFMAKVLQFINNSTLYEAEPVKIERKKIYGYKEISALDPSGNECRQCYLDASGTILIPPGAIKLSSLDEDGNTVERSEMILVDAKGNPPGNFPSSFDAPVMLEHTVSDEEFLDHLWKGVYQIDNSELAAAAGEKIYAFPFSYRGGHTCDEGFLLAENGVCFLFYGEKTDFPFLNAPDSGVLDDAEEKCDDDDFDFDMM